MTQTTRWSWLGAGALLAVTACAESSEPVEQTSSTLTSQLAAAPKPSVVLAGAGNASGRPQIRHRSKKDPNAKQHPTGRKELSANELAQVEANTPKVVKVLPTELAVERAREAGTAAPTARGLSGGETVPFGADLVTAPAGETTQKSAAVSAALALPRSADNSALPAFPEIRNQEGIGSCVAFAVGYYQYTYALGRLAGWNNKNGNNTTKVSPKWLYNLVNGGYDFGTAPSTVHGILKEHGALTWSEFPYSGDASNPINYREWPRTAALWRSALRYKSIDYASVELPTTPTALDQVKQMLVNGQVLTFGTYIYSWQFEQVDDDPSTSADNAFVGQNVATWMDGSEGSHEATVVGYNDDLWVDINANGSVDSGEKGAFKIANSWGNGWQNAGYAWVAYDALQWQSQVQNGPSSDWRGGIMWQLTALTGARTNYQPNLTAEFTASTANRSSLTLFAGLTELDRTDVVARIDPPAFSGNGGPYAYDGTETTQAKSGSFVIDLSKLAASYGDLKYRLQATNNTSAVASTVSGFALVDRLKNNLRTASTDAALTLGPGQTNAQTIRYKFQDPAAVPRLTVNPASSVAFGSLALGQSTKRSVTLTNTGTGDLLVTSLRFSNPLFLLKSAPNLRLAAGASTPVELEFAPASAQSESSTLSIRNTSSNNASPSLSLTGSGTSTNDSAPYQVFITGQNDLVDNSIAFRAELKSRVSTSTRLSDYQVVYYLSDANVDPSTLRWDTFYTTVGAVTASFKRIYLTRELGVRKADLAVTFRFASGATLPANGTVVFQGQLRNTNFSWYPNESDDWSRYVRANGMAEGTIVQAIASKNILFGLAAEGQPGAYQLAFSPNPVTTQTEGHATFVVSNPNQLNTEFTVSLISSQGSVVQQYWTYPSQLGTTDVVIPMNGDRHNPAVEPGRYTVVLKSSGVPVDAVEFTRQ